MICVIWNFPIFHVALIPLPILVCHWQGFLTALSHTDVKGSQFTFLHSKSSVTGSCLIYPDRVWGKKKKKLLIKPKSKAHLSLIWEDALAPSGYCKLPVLNFKCLQSRHACTIHRHMYIFLNILQRHKWNLQHNTFTFSYRHRSSYSFHTSALECLFISAISDVYAAFYKYWKLRHVPVSFLSFLSPVNWRKWKLTENKNKVIINHALFFRLTQSTQTFHVWLLFSGFQHLNTSAAKWQAK